MTGHLASSVQSASWLPKASTSATVLIVASLVLMKLFFLFQVQYFPTVNRVTYAWFSYNTFLFEPRWDSLILVTLSAVTAGTARKGKILTVALGAASVACAALFQQQQYLAMDLIAVTAGLSLIAMIVVYYFKGNTLLEPRWFLMSAAAAQTVILARWLVFPAYPTRIFGDASWKLNEVYASFQLVLGLLAPALVILIVFSFVLIPNRQAIAKVFAFVSGRARRSEPSLGKPSTLERVLLWRRLYLVIFVLAFTLPFYPYIQSINPEHQVLSVDATQYKLWIDQLKGATSQEEFNLLIFSEIQSGDRPLSLIIVYGIYNLVGQDYVSTFVILPPILSLLLVASVYFLVARCTEKRIYRNLSALMTLVSFQIITGMYIGFFSNWLAIVLVNVSIAFLFQYLNLRSYASLALMFAASVSILFVHSATWMYLTGSVVIFLGMSAYLDRRNARTTFFALAVVASIFAFEFAIDQTKSVLLDSVNTLTLNSDITKQKLGMEEFILRWNNLKHLFTIYLWGTLANVTLMTLTLIWCLKADLNDRFNRFLLSMFFVGSIPLIMGSFDVQSRLIYNMPFHIAAALLLGRFLESGKFSTTSNLVVIVLMLDLGVYLLRSLANMYFIAPS